MATHGSDTETGWPESGNGSTDLGQVLAALAEAGRPEGDRGFRTMRELAELLGYPVTRPGADRANEQLKAWEAADLIEPLEHRRVERPVRTGRQRISAYRIRLTAKGEKCLADYQVRMEQGNDRSITKR